MPKNKMLNLFLLILVLIISYLVWNNKSTQSEQNIVEIIDLAEATETNIVTQQETTLKEQKKQSDHTNAVEIKTFFDDDPVVDKEIIKQKYQHCNNLFVFLKNQLNKNDNSRRQHNNKDYLYTKQKDNKYYYKSDAFKKHKNYCQKLNKEHPEYNLDGNSPVNEIESNSYLGRLLSDNEFLILQFENNLDTVKIAIKNSDPNLLHSYISSIAYYTFTQEIRTVLQSQQNDYALIIVKYTETLYACRLGADCGENSAIMFQTCAYNSNLCADNFENLIKTKFSKGQQADIEIAYQVLVDFYAEPQ